MNHCRKAVLVTLVGLFLCLVASSLVAEAPSRGQFTRGERLHQLYKRFLSQLRTLEEKYPRDHPAFCKMRQTVSDLYHEAERQGVGDAVSNPARADTPADRRGRSMRRGDDPSAGVDIYDACRGLRGGALREQLHGLIANQYPVGYQQAQHLIFSLLHNENGEVECVYTGRRIRTQGEPSANDMNIEHTWPQSQGATGDAKCDLHHLFPTDAKANNLRGSYPFGDVTHPIWEEGGSKFDGDTFEVRPQHRGNCARAKFYFAVRYGKSIPDHEEAALRRWHKEDPVDDAERARNDRIENLQHNRNPFIDHPEFVDQINDF